MFKNCAQLLEISIDNDFININVEEPYKFEEFLDCNIDYNEGNYEDKNEYIYNNFYNNNYIYSNCSEITKKEERESSFYKSALTDIKNNIIIYQYNYYSNMSFMFCGCLSLSSLPDISIWNTNNANKMNFYVF